MNQAVMGNQMEKNSPRQGELPVITGNIRRANLTPVVIPLLQTFQRLPQPLGWSPDSPGPPPPCQSHLPPLCALGPGLGHTRLPAPGGLCTCYPLPTPGMFPSPTRLPHLVTCSSPVLSQMKYHHLLGGFFHVSHHPPILTQGLDQAPKASVITPW